MIFPAAAKEHTTWALKYFREMREQGVFGGDIHELSFGQRTHTAVSICSAEMAFEVEPNVIIETNLTKENAAIFGNA